MVQKIETRETITHVASEIFARYGYQKTTMDDISRACRKGKSSIYYYFKNKEEIFIAVLEKEILLLKSRLLIAIADNPGPEEKLRAYVKTRMKGISSLINFYNAIRDEYLSQFAFIERIRERYDKEDCDMVRGILEEGMKKEVFRIEDSEVTAIALVTAMKGFEIPLFFKGSPDSLLENRLDLLLNVLLNGLLRR